MLSELIEKMSMNSQCFLSFLENVTPDAARIGQKMEELIFEDPASSVVKARLYAEAILIEVFKIEEIDTTYLSSLFDKISYLTRQGVFKKEIQQSFDIIRLSGNKAAHDSNFDDITVAFKLHKEMYKIGVWFYEVYSNEHIKIPTYEIPKPRERENIQELVKKQILELLGTGAYELDKTVLMEEETRVEEQQLVENTDGDNVEKKEIGVVDNFKSVIIKDLPQDESYLLRELRRLKDSSQEAIENANQFSSFKGYLHVNRKIQTDLESILEKNKDRERGSLILLCGNVGDGKSHLLAHIKEKKAHLIEGYRIYNDATESFSPNKNAMETLEEVLNSFSDEQINDSNEKVILAINMGVLHNFISIEHKDISYNTLKQFVEESELFSQKITTHFSDEHFDLLSFGDYHSYELSVKGPQSSFYSQLLVKILCPLENNPFYMALVEDESKQLHTMVHENYKFLQKQFVQNQIVQLIIQTIITKKLVISARAFLNFVADILIPDEVQNIKRLTEFDVLENSLPNLLFNRRERSDILLAISHLDPIHRRSVYIDQLIVDLNTLSEWDSIIKKYVSDEIATSWVIPLYLAEI